MCAHSRKHFHKLTQVQKHFAHVRKFLQMCKCANVQMCKCAKNRRAQNAQICSTNFFPNATFAISQICTVHNFVCASFRQMHKLFLLCEIFYAHKHILKKEFINLVKKNNIRVKKNNLFIKR